MGKRFFLKKKSTTGFCIEKVFWNRENLGDAIGLFDVASVGSGSEDQTNGALSVHEGALHQSSFANESDEWKIPYIFIIFEWPFSVCRVKY